MPTGRRSAGILIYRRSGDTTEVLLVHPGGPFWKSRDRGAWQIPKGLIEDGEPPEVAARREAEEELGVGLKGALKPLGSLRQAGGKWVDAFALEQDIDPARVSSNTFSMEWPRGSGRIGQFPEVDEARWFSLPNAADRMLSSQLPLLRRLADLTAPAS